MTTETKFTKGPWVAEVADMFGDHNIVLTREADDCRAIAAVVSNMRPVGEVEANAYLTAASPDLYEVAAETEQLFRDLAGKVDSEFFDKFVALHFKARAALAKALPPQHRPEQGAATSPTLDGGGLGKGESA